MLNIATLSQPRHAPEPAPTFNQVNVNKLLTDLVSMGIIPGSKKPEDKNSSPAPASETPKTTVLPQPADTVSLILNGSCFNFRICLNLF